MFGRHKQIKEKHVRNWTYIDSELEAACPAAERAQALAAVPLLARLHPRDRQNLGAVGIVRSYRVGEVLVHEGQRPGVGLFVILRGRVRISQHMENRITHMSEADRNLQTLETGQMFGEMALLDEQPRSASVIAVEPTLAMIIPIVDFRMALTNNPEAAFWLLQVMSRRVRQAEHDVTHSAEHQATDQPEMALPDAQASADHALSAFWSNSAHLNDAHLN